MVSPMPLGVEMRRWGPRDKIVPIVVSDAVAAVNMGKWPARTPS